MSPHATQKCRNPIRNTVLNFPELRISGGEPKSSPKPSDVQVPRVPLNFQAQVPDNTATLGQQQQKETSNPALTAAPTVPTVLTAQGSSGVTVPRIQTDQRSQATNNQPAVTQPPTG